MITMTQINEPSIQLDMHDIILELGVPLSHEYVVWILFYSMIFEAMGFLNKRVIFLHSGFFFNSIYSFRYMVLIF